MEKEYALKKTSGGWNNFGSNGNFSKNSLDPNVKLQICWILDITGSMSSQLEGCKEAATKTAKIVTDQHLPVGFTVITYTESTTGSYASYHTFTDTSEAISFINSIKLSTPPDYPDVNAGGGDGDENVKLAIARLHQKHNFRVPTVCFFLTDAGYHETGRNKGQESQEEDKALKKMFYPTDLLKIWNDLDHDSLFFFPMIFGTDCWHTYGQFAKQTDGILLLAKGATPKQISDAMVKIISKIFNQINGVFGRALIKLDGFKIHDCSTIYLRESESDKSIGIPQPLTDKEAIDLLKTSISKKLGVFQKKKLKPQKFGMEEIEPKPLSQIVFKPNLLETKIVKKITMKGESWNKKKAAVNLNCLLEQMKLVGLSLKFLIRDKSVQSDILRCIMKIKKTVPKEQKEHIKLSMKRLRELKKEITSIHISDDLKDLVTLSSVKEMITDNFLEGDKEDALSSVCEVLYGFTIALNHIEDSSGNLDFSKPWESEISQVGIDLISLKSFIDLVNNSDGVSTTGLTDSFDYNSFIILAGEKGSLRWSIFQIVSGLQILDATMSLAVGGSITELIPGLHSGLLGSILVSLLDENWVQLDFKRISLILNTIKSIESSPLGDIHDLHKTHPVLLTEPISKLLVSWYYNKDSDNVLKLILNEIIWRKTKAVFNLQTPEGNKKYLLVMSKIFQINSIFGEFNQDSSQIHPLESPKLVDSSQISAILKESHSAENEEAKTILSCLTKYFNSHRLTTLVKTNKIFKEWLGQASNIWTIFHMESTATKLPILVDICEKYPYLIQDLIFNLLDLKDCLNNTTEIIEKSLEERSTLCKSKEGSLYLLLREIHSAKLKQRKDQRASDSEDTSL